MAAAARKQLNVRMSDEERAEVQCAADADRRTLSDYIRLAALDAARKGVRR